MNIRLYQRGDIEQVTKLFQDTVSTLGHDDYSETEIRMWAPDTTHFRDWEESCLQKFTLVAEVSNEIIGFAQLNNDGHINAFYCRPDHQGKGIGKKLYQIIEDYALSKGITKIYTEVHTSVRSFFTKLGFESLQKQKVLIQGDIKTNYVVLKELS
jgi:N-acetylglutamate synthase-like GNAT family acetyltransferase